MMHAPSLAKRLTAGALAKRLTVGALALGMIASAAPLAVARPVPDSFADLVEQVAPAVVNISTRQEAGRRVTDDRSGQSNPFTDDHPFSEFFKRFRERDRPEFRGPGLDDPDTGPEGRPRSVTGVGSGFVIDPDGYVVTNNHVIANASQITVTLGDGTAYEADLVGRDERTDLALLKVEAEAPLPAVSFGDSDQLRVGDWVMAVGNPYGLGGSVTAGIVSARGRDLRGGALNDFIQLDAPINRGNSGGPSFDSDGKVIGINTAIYSPNGGSVGIGFAIPSSVAAKVIGEIRANGQVERGWLGVRIQPMTPDIAEGFGLDGPRGALVASVDPDGPAAAAGLHAGDVITAWNGTAVEKVRDLPRLVADTPVGQEVEVGLWRNRESLTLAVTTGELPQRQASLMPHRSEPSGKETALVGSGITVTDLTPAQRRQQGAGDDQAGVLVLKVEPDSPAARQGLSAGDLIKRIGEETVTAADQAAVAFARAKKRGEAVITLMTSRNGEDSFLALRLADSPKLG